MSILILETQRSLPEIDFSKSKSLRITLVMAAMTNFQNLKMLRKGSPLDSEKSLFSRGNKLALIYGNYSYCWMFVIASSGNYFSFIATYLNHGLEKSLVIIVLWNHDYGDKAPHVIHRITIRRSATPSRNKL